MVEIGKGLVNNISLKSLQVRGKEFSKKLIEEFKTYLFYNNDLLYLDVSEKNNSVFANLLTRNFSFISKLKISRKLVIDLHFEFN